MIKDGQVRALGALLARGVSLRVAALKTGMDTKTARKYLGVGRMPSELSERHWWRTRPDPFANVWDEVGKQLEQNPGLQAKTLFLQPVLVERQALRARAHAWAASRPGAR